MGEIADMMLDGTLCEGCGVYLEGDGDGFPRYCSDECAAGRGALDLHQAARGEGPLIFGKRMGKPRNPRLHQCPFCDRKLRSKNGRRAHIRECHADRPGVHQQSMDTARLTKESRDG